MIFFYHISVYYLGVHYVCNDKTDNTFLAVMKFRNYPDAILASVERKNAEMHE